MQITDVIITHAHSDHYSGLSYQTAGLFLPAFPKARHFLGKEDWQPDSHLALEKNTLALVHEKNLLTLVEGEVDLGDGLSILPAPGETAGHQILLFEHDDLVVYFGGDLFHHPLEFIDLDLHGNWSDAGEIRSSKEEFINWITESGGWVYFSHQDSPYRVVRVDEKVTWIPE